MKNTKQQLKWDPLGCGEDIVYCDNLSCESPAFTTVSVSENNAGDSARNFCAPCAEAYTVGVRHGTLKALAELRAEQRGRAPTGQQGRKKKIADDMRH